MDIHSYNQSKKKDCYCPKCHVWIPHRKKSKIPNIKYLIPCYECNKDYVVFKPEYRDYLLATSKSYI